MTENNFSDFADVIDFPPDKVGKPKSAPFLIQSSAEFVRGFVPPDYLLDGILQRRFIYSMTAQTGHGKTAILLRLAAHIWLGRNVGAREVTPGRVLYLAGENPDDIRARWIGLSQEMAFDSDAEDGVYFLPGRFKISEIEARIKKEMAEIGGEFALIVVDTSAAYFEGDDENQNVQAGTHARRLRELVNSPGGPCVLVACHPIKNPAKDNLQPRGGGAFLNEVDGNLTAWKDDSAVTVHWQGKFRGPDFAEFMFGLRTITHQRLKDSRGRLMPTVISYPMGEDAKEEIAATARSQEDMVLLKLVEMPEASLGKLATAMGWNLRNGDPNKMMVSRKLDALEKAKLIKKERGGYVLTPAARRPSRGCGPAKTGRRLSNEPSRTPPANGDATAEPVLRQLCPASAGDRGGERDRAARQARQGSTRRALPR
jgi:AAA domain